MAYVAFVPARSGSKRIPGKNIKLLAGKPLVIHTLEAFVKTDKVDKVIFSTDSEEYWELVKSYITSDKLTLNFRSHDQAGDKVKIFDYLKDNYQSIFDNNKDVFLMGLPTVPLRNCQHVNEAIALFERNRKAIFSATKYGFPIEFAFNLDNDESSWLPVSADSPMLTGNTRSQDQKVAYHPNGAIYIREVMDLSKSNLFTLYNEALPYLMSREDSVDIDNEIDFKVAEAILDKRKEFG
jgi:CMP-N,N'-diacetyllegionaminic acid synthase